MATRSSLQRWRTALLAVAAPVAMAGVLHTGAGREGAAKNAPAPADTGAATVSLGVERIAATPERMPALDPAVHERLERVLARPWHSPELFRLALEAVFVDHLPEGTRVVYGDAAMRVPVDGEYQSDTRTAVVSSEVAAAVDRAARGDRDMYALEGLRVLLHELVHASSPAASRSDYERQLQRAPHPGTHGLTEEAMAEWGARRLLATAALGLPEGAEIPRGTLPSSPYSGPIGVLDGLVAQLGVEAVQQLWTQATLDGRQRMLGRLDRSAAAVVAARTTPPAVTRRRR